MSIVVSLGDTYHIVIVFIIKLTTVMTLFIVKKVSLKLPLNRLINTSNKKAKQCK